MIEFYTAPTANCRKVSIMLEEVGLSYRTHVVDLFGGEQFKDEFQALNTLSKCPVVIDDEGLDGNRTIVTESMAIAFYLAEKTGQLNPANRVDYIRAIEWGALISSGLGSAFSVLFTFKTFAPEDVPFASEHYDKDAYRHFRPFEKQLGQARYLLGDDYSLVDALAYPMFMQSEDRLSRGLDGFPNITRWRELIGKRPAVRRGMEIPNPAPK